MRPSTFLVCCFAVMLGCTKRAPAQPQPSVPFVCCIVRNEEDVLQTAVVTKQGAVLMRAKPTEAVAGEVTNAGNRATPQNPDGQWSQKIVPAGIATDVAWAALTSEGVALFAAKTPPYVLGSGLRYGVSPLGQRGNIVPAQGVCCGFAIGRAVYQTTISSNSTSASFVPPASKPNLNKTWPIVGITSNRVVALARSNATTCAILADQSFGCFFATDAATAPRFQILPMTLSKGDIPTQIFSGPDDIVVTTLQDKWFRVVGTTLSPIAVAPELSSLIISAHAASKKGIYIVGKTPQNRWVIALQNAGSVTLSEDIAPLPAEEPIVAMSVDKQGQFLLVGAYGTIRVRKIGEGWTIARVVSDP